MNNEYIAINIEPELKLICSEWIRGTSSVEFREGLQNVHNLIKEHGLQYWLIQARYFSPPVISDQSWCIDYLFSQLIQTDLKKIAAVLPSDHFMHMLSTSMIKKVHAKYGQQIKIECFSRIEHAKYWLLAFEESEGAITAYS